MDVKLDYDTAGTPVLTALGASSTWVTVAFNSEIQHETNCSHLDSDMRS
jgi:hypothetical protein